MKRYKYSEWKLKEPNRSIVYNAFAALGFKCAKCGSTKPVIALNKQGKEAHDALVKRIGKDWLCLVATNAEIRELYQLACKDCFPKLAGYAWQEYRDASSIKP